MLVDPQTEYLSFKYVLAAEKNNTQYQFENKNFHRCIIDSVEYIIYISKIINGKSSIYLFNNQMEIIQINVLNESQFNYLKAKFL
jgi:hypothetical protein